MPRAKTMATSKEVQLRISYARTLLEAGFKAQTVCTMLQARHPVSRSTAYKDITAAQAEIQTSDDGPAECEDVIDPDEMAAQARHMYNVAVARGEFKEASQAVKMLDTILKWNGRAATLHGSPDTGYV